MIRSSFLAGISESNSFGTLRLPNPFVEEFGGNLPQEINFICKEGFRWEGNYDNISRKVFGLERFMKSHHVKQMYTLLLDYHGDGKFDIKIYNSCGMEVDYSECGWHKCDNTPDNIKESEFILEIDTLEDEKAKMRFFFSGYGMKLPYYDQSIQECDIHPVIKKMKVMIEICGDDCYLVDGWNKFVEDSGLEKDDIIIFNVLFTMFDNLVYVCLYKREDIQMHRMSPGKEGQTVSFFHVLNPYTWLYEEIVPPMIVRKFYDRLLSSVNTLSCGDLIFPVSYKSDIQSLGNIKKVFEQYDLWRNDTFFFTITEHHQARMRIYRRDGMEVDYRSQSPRPEIIRGHWFMKEIWKEEYSDVRNEDYMELKSEKKEVTYIEISDMSDNFDEDGSETPDGDSENNGIEIIELSDGSDDDGIVHIGDNILGEFTSTLSKSHVGGHCHGVYISRSLDAIVENWPSGKMIFFRRGEQIWNIGINITNGRKRFSAGWDKFVRDNELK
ncbi:hypothetical protein POM88_006290 [Heracleum sosnowskyi]|uniref:TF-B3 domain-containing protein n=1 Tax=Heracleum sosnowskyi TaxID=360622 RepID=A0AAD8J2D5_9APIA|nr:hypothetical protein POM88_006290 [Heracleum sosnowskyi]